jgi:hypothetical protein
MDAGSPQEYDRTKASVNEYITFGGKKSVEDTPDTPFFKSSVSSEIPFASTNLSDSFKLTPVKLCEDSSPDKEQIQ